MNYDEEKEQNLCSAFPIRLEKNYSLHINACKWFWMFLFSANQMAILCIFCAI